MLLAGCMLAAKTGSVIPTSGLVVEYTMDSVSGSTLIDTSGSGLDGTINGSSFAAGQIGNAVTFSSSSDYITRTDTAAIRPATFSVSMWLNFTTGSNLVIAEKDGNSGWSIQSAGPTNAGGVAGRVLMNARGTGSSVYGTTVINDGNWHHVVFINNGGSDKVYIDNTDVTVSSTIGDPLYSTGPLILGQRVGGIAPWPGAIDQFRLYNRAISASEVTQLYNET